MKVSTLLSGLSFALASAVQPAGAFPLIFDNITPNEGQNYGSFSSPTSLKDTGFGFDAGAADDFVLSSSPHFSGDWLVMGLTWSGVFSSGAPIPITGFRIIFWPKETETTPAGGTPAGNAPDYSQALAIFENVSALSSPGGGGGGGSTFDYAADLPAPFLAEDGIPYWLEVQPSFNYPPLWNWQVTFRRQLQRPVRGWDLFSTPFWSPNEDEGDLAFTLSGVPVPEPAALLLIPVLLLAPRRRRRR